MIFSGAALLATAALYLRQSLLVAYILLGILLGPWGLSLVNDAALFKEAAHIGIIFLLFLLGLDLQPQELLGTLRNSTLVTMTSSLVFAVIGFAVAWVFGFAIKDAVLVGAAMMFSSTIIGVKLLPTTALHHQHVGEIIISVLLLQDMIAIIVLLLLEGYSRGGGFIIKIALIVVYLPGLIGFAFLFERYVLIKLIQRFDKIQEYIFLVAIGWCLGMAELASALGLSAEIGAFIAGVVLATSPIALFIAQSLRPLRDFFLVMFFFALGAGLDFSIASEVIFPAMVLAGIALIIKPAMFKWLLKRTGETPALSGEIGVRLGQISEFSLLIAVLAMNSNFIDNSTSYLIQIATLLTFIVSSYWVVMRYPTPIAISDKLRRD
jgi:Kef-type K+ transport system membrane component KefB